MSAPQIPPSGPPAPSSPSGAGGLVALPSEIVRLPQELAARLLNGLRTVFVSGTVTGQGADGALRIRSQFGEIAVRAGSSVPADRQVSLQIPPLTGKAATLTPPQLSRNPIPASLLLSKPVPTQPVGETPASNIGSSAVARAAPPVGSPGAAIPSAPSTTPVPLTAGPPESALPAAGARPTPAQSSPTAAPAQSTAVPATANPAGRLSPVPQAQQAPAATGPALTSGDPSVPAAPPLGRLALAAQLLTQSSSQPAANPQAPAAPQATPQATPPAAQPAAQPPVTAPLPQGATAQASTTPAAGGVTVSFPSSGPVPMAVTPTMGAGTGTVAPQVPLPISAGEIAGDAIPLDSLRRVPSLREAVSVLSAADPTLATQFVRSVLPQANTQLAATLLFFLAATRSGDIRGWMGERVTSSLDAAGRADLLPKLSAELATPTRTSPDAPATEWRSQTVPLYQDGDIGGMAVHMRRPGDESGEAGEGEPAGRRFLIDMDLSRIGPLQFDGLVNDTRFDLTIRSPAAFPENMRDDMRALFRDASNAVGLYGGLTFQAGGHDWATVATARGG